MHTRHIVFTHFRKTRRPGRAGVSPCLAGVLALVVWSVVLGTVCLYFARADYSRALFYSYWKHPAIVGLNLLPVLFFTLLVFLLSNRIWISVFLSGSFLTVLSLINYYKVVFRNDPLLASDAAYIAEAVKIGGKYEVVLTADILLVFGGILAASILAFFLRKTRFRSLRPRLVLLALLLAAGSGLYFGLYRSEAVYNNTSHLDIELPGRVMSTWSDTDNYVCRGFLYPFIHSTTELVNLKPEGYSKTEAAAMLNSYVYEDIPEDQKVSVIGVMLEAYNDLSVFDTLDLNADPYSFFHELQSESLSGHLVTNIFAGGTIDTERCFLTGSTEMYEYRSAAFSYARYFNDQGYFTEFLHPGYSWVYNRKNVAEYLGFQASHFNDDLFVMPWEDTMMNDDEAFLLLIDEYEKATGDGAPYFGFTVTYQNHGPYADSYLYDETTEYVKKDGLSEEAYNIMNNYLWGIQQTDNALREYFDYYRSLSKPVVIVLFGDHKPWLGNSSFVYAELGIDLSRSSDESFYNYYETPYIIWANDAAKAVLAGDFAGDGGDFSPFLLMPRLFNECGWGGDEYMKACRELWETLDVVHVTGVVRENGRLISKPSEAAETALNRLLMLQYYLMRDAYR